MLETFLLLLGAVALAALAYWFWAKRTDAELSECAGEEWSRLKSADPALLDGLDETRFRAIYRRVHFPRFPKYALAIVAAFVIALPLTLGVLAGVAWGLDSIGLSADAAAIAKSVPVAGATNAVSRDDGETVALYYVQDVLKFYYYFGLIFVWLGIIFFAMRRFHRRRPGYLRDEILAEKPEGSAQ